MRHTTVFKIICEFVVTLFSLSEAVSGWICCDINIESYITVSNTNVITRYCDNTLRPYYFILIFVMYFMNYNTSIINK